MERVSVTVERSENVRLVLGPNETWLAKGPAFEGKGSTPSEALEDYRRQLEVETSHMVERLQAWQRHGWLVLEPSRVPDEARRAGGGAPVVLLPG